MWFVDKFCGEKTKIAKNRQTASKSFQTMNGVTEFHTTRLALLACVKTIRWSCCRSQKICINCENLSKKNQREYKRHKQPASIGRFEPVGPVDFDEAGYVNKRRGGEASNLATKAYQEKMDWSKATSSKITKSLNMFEKELSRR